MYSLSFPVSQGYLCFKHDCSRYTRGSLKFVSVEIISALVLFPSSLCMKNRNSSSLSFSSDDISEFLVSADGQSGVKNLLERRVYRTTVPLDGSIGEKTLDQLWTFDIGFLLFSVLRYPKGQGVEIIDFLGFPPMSLQDSLLMVCRLAFICPLAVGLLDIANEKYSVAFALPVF